MRETAVGLIFISICLFRKFALPHHPMKYVSRVFLSKIIVCCCIERSVLNIDNCERKGLMQYSSSDLELGLEARVEIGLA